MIRIRLFGNLGNQMFQYAFAKITASKTRSKFVFSTRHVKYALHYFELPFPLYLYNNKLLRSLNSRIEKFLRFKNIEDYSNPLQDSSDYVYSNNTEYLGYFQDSKLYEDRERIRKLFKIKSKYEKEYNARYRNDINQQKTITISVRLGDYRAEKIKEFGNVDALLPLEWYKRQLNLFDLDQYKVYIISDEPDTCEAELSTLHKNIHIVREHFITQLLILSHADVCIISNSTFAWWGAYLNRKQNVKIIAPK